MGLNLLGTATLSNDEHLFVALVVPVWQLLSSMTASHFAHSFMYEAEKISLVNSSNEANYCTQDLFFPHVMIYFLAFFCRFQDFLGQTFCTLGEIVGSPASRLEKPLG